MNNGKQIEKKKYPLLVLLLCSALAYTSGRPLFACEYPNDPDLAEQKKNCLAASNKSWSCESNRCLENPQDEKTREDYERCAGLAYAEQKACFDKLAQEKVGEQSVSEPSKMLGYTSYALTITLAALNYFGTKSKTSCTSKTIFNGSAVASLAAEAYFYFFLKKKLKDFGDKYEKSDDTYTMQVNAFKYLKAEQDAIASVAKQKSTIYYGLTAGYGAATAVAIYEMTPYGLAGACKLGDTLTADNGKQDYAKGGFWETFLGGTATDKLSTMSNYFKTSPGIATASGMAAAISMKLGLDYSKQSEEAKKNADDIQKIIDNFTDSISEFCPQGRDSLTQPKCYCYNTDGSRNENRSNSQTCQTLWAANETNIFKEAGDYSKIASVASLGCVTQNGDFDQNCDCKKFANASGENACYKSKYFGSNLGNLGSQLSLPAIGQGINALAQGDYSGAQGLANTNNANLAVKNQKIARQMLDQLNAKNKKPLRIDAKMADDLVRSVASNKALNTGRGLLGEGLDTLNNPGSAAPATGAEQIKEAINKAGLDKPQVDFQKDEDSGKTKGSDDYNLNFKGDEQSNSTTTPSVQNFMNKQYDFKDNDINRKSSESIWNIISNRYTQSGLRRLFNE